MHIYDNAANAPLAQLLRLSASRGRARPPPPSVPASIGLRHSFQGSGRPEARVGGRPWPMTRNNRGFSSRAYFEVARRMRVGTAAAGAKPSAIASNSRQLQAHLHSIDACSRRVAAENAKCERASTAIRYQRAAQPIVAAAQWKPRAFERSVKPRREAFASGARPAGRCRLAPAACPRSARLPRPRSTPMARPHHQVRWVGGYLRGNGTAAPGHGAPHREPCVRRAGRSTARVQRTDGHAAGRARPAHAGEAGGAAPPAARGPGASRALQRDRQPAWPHPLRDTSFSRCVVPKAASWCPSPPRRGCASSTSRAR